MPLSGRKTVQFRAIATSKSKVWKGPWQLTFKKSELDALAYEGIEPVYVQEVELGAPVKICRQTRIDKPASS